MPQCEATYPNDPSVQCQMQADPPGTFVKHEHKAKTGEGWEFTWRDTPTGGFDG